MFIIFQSKVDADILMHGEHALALIERMAPYAQFDTKRHQGLIEPHQLRNAIIALESLNTNSPTAPTLEDEPRIVPLAHRAVPLLSMLRHADQETETVSWQLHSA